MCSAVGLRAAWEEMCYCSGLGSGLGDQRRLLVSWCAVVGLRQLGVLSGSSSACVVALVFGVLVATAAIICERVRTPRSR